MLNDTDSHRKQFGNRFLKNDEDVFLKNAWDNFSWTEDIQNEIDAKILNNSQTKLSTEVKDEKVENSAIYWNNFYLIHTKNFFKDRHWLITEFPELLNNTDKTLKVFEVGCGVGNTIFPLIKENRENGIYVYGCDLSEKAINILKSHDKYDEDKFCKVFVNDITNNDDDIPIEENSLDIITMIFVLSSISPKKMKTAVTRLIKLLKPGGFILFRDYGKYDMTQVRFKDGHCLEENFYMRGDGTLVYFFTEEEVEKMFTDLGKDVMEKVVLYTDRRLLINRARQSKMYRIWLTGKFRKL